MSVFAVAAREGTRLVRSSPTRSAIVAVTIAGATALGVREGSVAVGCVALSVAVTVVAWVVLRPGGALRAPDPSPADEEPDGQGSRPAPAAVQGR